MSTYAELVARGCLCGTDRIAGCPIHTKPSDNRGIAAFFKAGMPTAFPLEATCSTCRSGGLLYPNVEIDDPHGSGEYRPTLICPRCSAPGQEGALVRDAEAFGYELNDQRIFEPMAVAS